MPATRQRASDDEKRDAFRRERCSVSDRAFRAELLGPYWDHGIAELGDLPGHSPPTVKHLAFLFHQPMTIYLAIADFHEARSHLCL